MIKVVPPFAEGHCRVRTGPLDSQTLDPARIRARALVAPS